MRRPCLVCGTPAEGGRCPNPDHVRKPWTRAVPRVEVPKPKRQAILKRDRGVCYVCGRGGADEVDHVRPLARGGTNDPTNLRAIHAEPCHAEKSKRERTSPAA